MATPTSPRPAPAPRAARIARVEWRPEGAYALAVEVLTIERLRRKESAAELARPQSVRFFVLIGVTRGRARHRVDFAPIDARPGTWMLLRPGQLQQFDLGRAWDGWLIVFRPDVLPPRERRARGPSAALDALLDGLPSALQLPRAAHTRCCEAAARMAADAREHSGGVDERNALLLHELGALLARLRLAAPARADRPRASSAARQRGTQGAHGAAPIVSDASGERLRRLRALVAEAPDARRPVAWYAERLGCSAKTLGRAVRQGTGQAVKPWLDEQLALEARRLLVHGSEPVKRVADRLGFADAANFVKFFKRVVGTTPAAFRAGEAAA
jgi:AraC-like DNA-binding protein